MNGYDSSVTSTTPTQPQDSSVPKKMRPSNRIQILNLPKSFTQEGINQLVATCGSVKRTNIINAETGPFANVTFETSEEAQKAVEELNNKDYEGAVLKVEAMTNNSYNTRTKSSLSGPRYKTGYQSNSRGSGFPLRLLVPSEYVGAIIGRKGQTIRTITTKCKARVDVHGKENSGLVEKVISVFGHPENCTNACKEILLVMQQEASANNRGDVVLKMLADDRYCGRIIGKGGNMIKKIRDDTGTKINVSNSAQEMAVLFPDRVIAIRGSVDGMAQAEGAIAAKLAECIEQEANSGMGGMMMMGPNSGYYPSSRGGYDMGPGYYTPQMYGAGPMGPVSSGLEICQVAVPNAAVGAIIGTAGANIKQMMRDSGAFVNIESKKDGDPTIERLVTIKGNTEACWRANYMVFEKMKLEGFGGNEDVRLKTVIRIPKPVVGRIIGKGGKNVRDIQRATGAMIKLPEDPSVQGEEVAVEVYGNFMATQTAHGRIRAMVAQSQQGPYSNGGAPIGLRGSRSRQSTHPPLTSESQA